MIHKTYLKSWPADYHSQSAIEAILQLRPKIQDVSKVAKIHIGSFEAAVSIIGSEPEKWRPNLARDGRSLNAVLHCGGPDRRRRDPVSRSPQSG